MGYKGVEEMFERRLSNIKKPWILQDKVFNRDDYVETTHLDVRQTVGMVFKWWTLDIYINDDGMCKVTDVWWME